MQMTEPAGREALAQAQFVGLVESLGGRPTVAYLVRPSLVSVLQPAAEALDLLSERVENLPALEAAREFMERATMRE